MNSPFAIPSARQLAIARKYKNALIISADTIVVLKNRVFGKPRDKEDAREMLKALKRQSHTVITGYTIMDAETGKKTLPCGRIEGSLQEVE